MIAAAAMRRRDDLQLHPHAHGSAAIKLLEMGARVEERDDAIRVRSIGDHRAVTFKTQVYPGFRPICGSP